MRALASAHQRVDRELRFQPGQGRAEAVVNAAAERQVLVVGSRQVQSIRLAKRDGIAVGRAEQRRDDLAPLGSGRRESSSQPGRSERFAALSRRSEEYSSTALPISVGFRVAVAADPGWRSSASMPLPIRLTVVS